MKQTRLLMGMPIIVEVVDKKALQKDIDVVFDYFTHVDKVFSTYKKNSEISKINRGLGKEQWSSEMKQVLSLCEQTKRETHGYFDIKHNNKLDPSGLVKGWAIQNAAHLLSSVGFKNFYIEAGGDIQVKGHSPQGKPWSIGIRNPFDRNEVVKVVILKNKGIATSGTAIRGQHVYDPHKPEHQLTEIVSLSVIGPNIYEADRFATAAFAMGAKGLAFIEGLLGFEAYAINNKHIATMTSGFDNYVKAA